MSFIFIDRRRAGKNKSAPNRQRLIKRIRSFIKSSNPQNIGHGPIAGGSNTTSPVKVAGSALEEPYFAYAQDGYQSMIIIGNTEYDRGDRIDFPEDEDGGAGGAGNGDNGEDDFLINIARDEFLDLFFEDCELPNLKNEKYTEKIECTNQHAGFSNSGNPTQLNIVRSFKQMIGRRSALAAPLLAEIERLEAELDQLALGSPADTELEQAVLARAAEIHQRIAVLHTRIAAVSGFDKVDLRFRKKEARPLKTVSAVLILMMDISGSMDENKKTIARRWFALLYAFIKRKYPDTELVFIAHTSEAFEMNEGDFFSTRVNGGTAVSPALKMAGQIIRERYNSNETNIYICHASDGDNWADDNSAVMDELLGQGNLLNKIQMFSYVEVGKPHGYGFSKASAPKRDTNLWETYDRVRVQVQKKKVTLSIIESAEECYRVFKKVFKKSRTQ